MVSYGVDGLFGGYYNRDDDGNAAAGSSTQMIVSAGFHTVSFLPVVGGVLATEAVRRLNIGGFHLINYVWRSMQLKYPAHVNSITIGRAEEILQHHCR